MSEGFKTQWNFPHCLGAIDGKHVAMKKPPGSGSFYYNYKKFFSIVLMAVVNANYEFLMVDVGVNGRVSDGGVISHTEFGKKLHDNELGIPEPDTLHENDDVPMPYVFVGDDAFAMTENLLKPFSEANGKLDEGKRTFNYRLSRARRVVENAFGILSSRFGVFQRQIPLSPDKSQIITLACCYLHNFLRRKSSRYIARESVDWEDANRDMHEGEWRAFQVEFEKLLPTHQRNFSARAKFTREMFQKYFCSKGMVPWQLDSIS